MSLQEEEARQAAATRQQAGTTSSGPSQGTAEAAADAPRQAEMADVKMAPESMDDELTKALAMSRGEDVELVQIEINPNFDLMILLSSNTTTASLVLIFD
jgi:hypothetical protein